MYQNPSPPATPEGTYPIRLEEKEGAWLGPHTGDLEKRRMCLLKHHHPGAGPVALRLRDTG